MEFGSLRRVHVAEGAVMPCSQPHHNEQSLTLGTEVQRLGDNLVMYDVEDDTMVACPGTTQGESGWYAEPCANGRVVAIYWEVLANGEWVRREDIQDGSPVLSPPIATAGPPIALLQRK